MLGMISRQQFEPFASQIGPRQRNPGQVAAGFDRLATKASGDRVGGDDHHHGNRLSNFFRDMA